MKKNQGPSSRLPSRYSLPKPWSGCQARRQAQISIDVERASIAARAVVGSPKKVADVRETLDERGGSPTGRLHDRTRAAGPRRVGAAVSRGPPQRPTASGHAAVQSVVPRLPHQTADDEPALRSRTVAEFRGRTGSGDAGGDQQRHAPHAGLQIPFRARTDRSDRCVPENDTHSARSGKPGALSGCGRPETKS